jgi:predicted nuclease of predicted toxin-antitoxin system
MKYVFDESVSDKIARALRELGKDCDPYSSHWVAGTADLAWIPIACSQGWCIVTADELLQDPEQRKALRNPTARVIVFAIANLRYWDQVMTIFERWEQVEKVTLHRKPPYVLRFTTRGKDPQELRV